MLRIHFNAEDLARTRISTTFGPFAETLFSVQAARWPSDEALLGAWRGRTRRALSPTARSLTALFPPRVWTLDLFTLVGQETEFDAALEALMAVPRDQLRLELGALPRQWRLPSWVGGLADNDPAARRQLIAAVTEFHRVAVQPHWERIRTHLEAHLPVAGRILREGGTDRLLATLHPDLRWRPPVLEIERRTAPSRDMFLGGRGLILVPSLFRRKAPPVFSAQADEDGPAVLFYPAPTELAQGATLWVPRRPTHQALMALLGQTRAEVLELIAEAAVTGSEIARRLGIAPASVSEHATVLREAGLTARHRLGGAVLHSITPVGVALLNGAPPRFRPEPKPVDRPGR